MSRPTIRHGIAAGLAAVVTAAGFAACTPKTLALFEPPKVTAENENEIVGTPPAYLGGPEDHPSLTTVRVRPTPILTHPLETYSDHDLVEYLDSLQYDADTATSEIDSVMCIHQPSGTPCGPTEAARVFIEPEVGMNKWAKPSIPKYGLIASRIINYDTTDRAEAHFGFPAHRRVWWVVDSIPGGHGMRSRYFVRNYSAKPPAVTFIGGPWEFNECLHVRGTRPKYAKAKFMDCLQSAVYSSATIGGDPITTPARGRDLRQSFHTAAFGTIPVPEHPYIKALTDTWVTCDAGCCSTSH